VVMVAAFVVPSGEVVTLSVGVQFVLTQVDVFENVLDRSSKLVLACSINKPNDAKVDGL